MGRDTKIKDVKAIPKPTINKTQNIIFLYPRHRPTIIAITPIPRKIKKIVKG